MSWEYLSLAMKESLLNHNLKDMDSILVNFADFKQDKALKADSLFRFLTIIKKALTERKVSFTINPNKKVHNQYYETNYYKYDYDSANQLKDMLIELCVKQIVNFERIKDVDGEFHEFFLTPMGYKFLNWAESESIKESSLN